jgi:predicted nucleotidyltransferase
MKITQRNILNLLKNIKIELKDKGILQLALFGSYATNTQNIYSDIDIAIVKDMEFIKENGVYSYFDIVNEIKTKLKNKFHTNIDIFDLDSNSEFKSNIKKELIYV